jgi:hypothetical protein
MTHHEWVGVPVIPFVQTKQIKTRHLEGIQASAAQLSLWVLGNHDVSQSFLTPKAMSPPVSVLCWKSWDDLLGLQL